MNRAEIGEAVLTITCMAWARIHHWRAGRRAARSQMGTAKES